MQIDGRALSRTIIRKLSQKRAPQKQLVGILVGSDKSSLSFLKYKERVAKELGIPFLLKTFPVSMTEKALEKAVRKISDDPKVGGIVVELPLPAKFSRQRILDQVDPRKDPDCLSSRSLGDFYTGESEIHPLAVGTVEEIMKHLKTSLKDKKVVVIGAGLLIGKPIATWLWLQSQVAEIRIFTRNTKGLEKKVSEADIVISGAGRAHLFSTKDVKPGAIIIDFGYDEIKGNVRGDFNPNGNPSRLQQITYTPVPGGAGPLLIAKLFENFYRLNEVRK
jgi:methylenetetrahydrofolate dehydrogenase (NADP+)/methenyltetrahydrofolate cyclohydrolase